MSVAAPARPERRQRATQLVAELQSERHDLWSLYCQIGELKPFADVEAVKAKLTKFDQLLVDYISLGHFGLYERILAGNERRDRLQAYATQIYQEFSAVTDLSVRFNDKYAKVKNIATFSRLAEDLSELGESLAKRFDLEDRLCELMQR